MSFVRRSRSGVRLIVAITLLSSMIAFSPAAAPAGDTTAPKTPFNLEVLGHHDGIFSSVDTTGSVLLTVQGSALVAYDVSGADPAIVGTADVPMMQGNLYISGARAYVVGAYQVAIYDIETPQNPSYEGIWELSSAYTITGFAAEGDYAYVGWSKEGYSGTKLVDVADPLHPEIVGYPSMYLHDMRADVVDGSVYSASEDGVDVYDITEPLHPVTAGVVPVADCLDAVHDGDFLYVSSGDVEGDDGDVSVYVETVAAPSGVQGLPDVPADPDREWALIGSASGGAGTSIAIAGDELWRTTPAGLELSDVASRTAPAVVETDVLADTSLVAAVASHAFVLTQEDVTLDTAIYGFETTSNPGFDTQYWMTEGHYGDSAAVISGDYAYVSSADGMHVLDITDPAAPELIGSVGTTESANDVGVLGDTAYVAADNGLYVVDITDPSNPGVDGYLYRSTGFDRVAVTTETVWATVDYGVVSVGVADPGNPTIIDAWNAPNLVWDIAVDAAGEFGYVTYGPENSTDCGVAMITVSDPAHPATLNTHGIPGGAPTVSVNGDYAYVAMMNPTWGGSAVKIFDVSSGDYLNYKKYYDLGSWNGSDVFAQDGEIYTVGQALQKWGVYSPTMPYLTGYSPVSGQRVYAQDDLVVVSSPAGGVTFLEYSAVSFRSFGGDRFDTSVKMSETFDSSEYVVLATGRSFPDALAGVPLAYALNAPILLVDSNSIPDEIVTEIERLGATKAIVLGGDAAVGEGVVDQLEAMGFLTDDIERLWGRTRYDTAKAIAEKLEEILGEGTVDKVFIATGENFPDALAASGVAAKAGCPILLVKENDLPSAAAQAVAALGATEVVIVGGDAVVSSDVTDELLLLGILPGNIDRVSGSNRYATAVEIANWALTDPDAAFDCDDIFVVTGTNFPDALSCGPVAAGDSAPTVLVGGDVPSATRDFVQGNAAQIGTVNVIGGTSAVSSDIERWLATYSE